MKIDWAGDESKDLYFDDLKVNETFRIVSSYAKGAVYVKVNLENFLTYLDQRIEIIANSESIDSSLFEPYMYAMLEIATGKVCKPTLSKVERVDVSVKIDAMKPSIYNDGSPF